ncbi:MAG: alpha-L-fucosidase [Bacteroidales bacterium]
MKIMNRAIVFSLLMILHLSLGLAQEAPKQDKETDPLVLARLEQWKNLKFGLLMHWGTYSQWGIVESWSLCSEDEPWCTRGMKSYVDYCKAYVQLKNTFNPVKFDPDKWAVAAKYAGMKYVVFTTKHHDGFCMFDTKQTDYKITAKDCPFSANPRNNVAKEIFDAFRKQGFWTGAYFSKPDWHSNDYWAEEWATPNRNVNYSIKKYPERWTRFCDFTYNQINELTTQYGKMDILWLDGGWVSVQNGQDINMPKIAEMARKNQPGIIVVDRAVGGRYENYRTPEQEIPDTPPDYLWETCMTMAGSWSYVPGDIYKPANKIIHMLADVVCKGGNYLLNIGPSPEGTLADTAYARLREIGDWMKINGESIYNSRPAHPPKYKNICFTSGPDGSIYCIYLAAADEKTMPESLFIGGFQPSKKSSVSLLGKTGNLKWKQEGEGFRIFISHADQVNPPCRHAWVFRMTECKKSISPSVHQS